MVSVAVLKSPINVDIEIALVMFPLTALNKDKPLVPTAAILVTVTATMRPTWATPTAPVLVDNVSLTILPKLRMVPLVMATVMLALASLSRFAWLAIVARNSTATLDALFKLMIREPNAPVVIPSLRILVNPLMMELESTRVSAFVIPRG
jgi:hypothetical protein